MQPLAEFGRSTAFAVFLGTLPLLGTILWNLLANNRQFDIFGKQFDQVNKQFDQVNKRLDRIDDRLTRLEVNVADVRERLAVVETRIEGWPLIKPS
jgi:septal ring factor EnvC (AmiA/AmiB activator)